MAELTERRRAPRAKFSGAVIVSTPPGRELTCAGANVSEGGMLLFGPRHASAPIGMPVHIRFTLPRLYRWLDCQGLVVRQASLNRQPTWGIAFSSTAPETRRAIRTFVVVGHGQVTEYHQSTPN